MAKVELDSEGFLVCLDDWSQDVAIAIAQAEHIHLSAEHWEVIYALREFYSEFELSPAMRPLTKYLAIKLGKEKSSSLYLLSLFPGSPAKISAKIAGLPKPENCL